MNIDQTITSLKPAASKAGKLDPAQKLKLEKAVREFESVFVGYLLKSMRNTVQKADNQTDSFGGDMLESMFDVELARHVSKNSNLGLAEMLYRKMTNEELPDPGALKRIMEGSGQHRTVGIQPVVAVRDAVALKSDDVSRIEQRMNQYNDYIVEAAAKHGVSERLIKAVIASESAGKANAQSTKDAKGLMQLIDTTAADMGVRNVWDPRENILGGAKYLKNLLEQFDGDEKLAVASYNAGPANVVKHGGIPPFKETKAYVARVMNFLQVFAQRENNNE